MMTLKRMKKKQPYVTLRHPCQAWSGRLASIRLSFFYFFFVPSFLFSLFIPGTHGTFFNRSINSEFTRRSSLWTGELTIER